MMVLMLFSLWHPNDSLSLTVVLPYLKIIPQIDGVISGEEKSGCVVLSNFCEISPREIAEPQVKTEVLAGYNAEMLYVAFICYEDDVTKIRGTFTERDKFVPGDDAVIIVLNTTGDLSENYYLSITPANVIYDAIATIDGMNCNRFDFEFKARAKIHRNCWVAEFSIPFSSLKIEKGKKHVFRAHFYRGRRGLALYSWVPLRNDDPAPMKRAGYLILEEDILPVRKRVFLMPYLSLSQEDSFSGIRTKAGITGKYKIASNYELDFTFYPDFSQVETDAYQIEVNTPYALYYPEKRPFFYNGISFLMTPLNVVYTRTINNPVFGTKITGAFSGYRFYFLSALDRNTVWVVPQEDGSEIVASNRSSYSTILRGGKEIFSASYVGVVVLDRELRSGYSRVVGGDFTLRFLRHFTMGYYGYYSFTQELEDTLLFQGFDGEYLRGWAQYVDFSALYRYLYSSFQYEGVSPSFRSDLGYIYKNNYRRINAELKPIFYLYRFGIISLSPGMNYSYEKNFDGVEKYRGLRLYVSTDLKGGNTFTISYENYSERFLNVEFPHNRTFSFQFFLFPFEWASTEFSFSAGKGIMYEDPPFSVYKSLWSIYLSLNPSYNFNITFSASTSSGYENMFKQKIYQASVLVSKINLGLSPSLSVRLINQYSSDSGTLSIYPLISYLPTPFDIFYVGCILDCSLKSSLRLLKYQAFVKVQHQFKF
ncbi:hypothetical protein DRQ20_02615 [bacterium]|nr:MAG: hypothetical protein DRQ20_02615 [bacterium]